MSIELTQKEVEYLDNWCSRLEAGEVAQVQDLINNCNNAFQFAKTHSVYVKDWEKTKRQMETDLAQGTLPSGISRNLLLAIVEASNKIMQRKLVSVQEAFFQKFGESIFNYLAPDGKTKKIFGIFG